MAGELHPGVTLLEGDDKGGPLDHGLQLLPRLVLGGGGHRESMSGYEMEFVRFLQQANTPFRSARTDKRLHRH